MTHLFSTLEQISNSSGTPNAGALLNFYQTTTTTPITVYQDSGKVTPHTNPVVADASGLFPPIYVDTDTYKVVLTTSAAVVIQTIDPIIAPYGTAVTKFGDGAVGAPSITFTADTNTGIWRVGADEIGISLGGLKLIDLSTTKAVINTTVTTAAAAPTGTELQIVANGPAVVAIDSAGTFGPIISMRRANGTQASKTAISANFALGTIEFYGTDSTSYLSNPSANIIASATENWGASAHGTSITISTRSNASAGVSPNNSWVLGQDASLQLPTVTSSATGSAIWFNGSVYHANTVSGADRVIDAEQFVFINSAPVTLVNSSTSAQAIFPASIDTLTVEANVLYFFEAIIYLGTGATSHTTAFGLGGTATFNSVMYFSELVSAAATTVATTCSYLEVLAATATVLNAASTAVTTKIMLKGHFYVSTGGTIIPQVTFSAGPTGTCQTNIGSFFRCFPVGVAVSSVGPWA